MFAERLPDVAGDGHYGRRTCRMDVIGFVKSMKKAIQERIDTLPAETDHLSR
ncbi:MAG: hypothetical protein R3F54_15265 [Alphaproteobacteria bacterium]